ncbi:MAG TPA: DNA gyrase inhibitor YacG [Rhodocyclaceae bacterium]|nr:DNA gyrase inhibitor YacG [Rhodocyclaceae bacterium]
MSSSPRLVRCPQCGNKAPWSPDNPWRPFCCERCKQIDLGAWASDSYSIAGQAASADDSPAAHDA